MRILSLLIFLIVCVSCSPQGSKSGAEQDREGASIDKFTITNTADDSEEVLIYIGNTKQQLPPGGCITLSRDNFTNLNIKAGAGGRSFEAFNVFQTFSEIDLCAGKLPKCAPGNYEIQDKGGLFDDYRLIPVEKKNPSCADLN